jgi:pyruvate dehydrogenase E1 component beta subunit
MPATAADARDLLVAGVLSGDPVMYIDDRWLYARKSVLGPVVPKPLAGEGPVVRRPGRDVTLAGAGYSAYLCEEAALQLAAEGIDAEVVDVRVLNPFDPAKIVASARKTGALCVVDGGWSPAGFAAEIVAAVVESPDSGGLRRPPCRVTLPFAPAPASRALEAAYYPTADTVSAAVRRMLGRASR